ncbi:MAG TPA: LytR C-terminal domain-containing protein [Coriobacteriia bacterium]|jgi:hypothetical protein
MQRSKLILAVIAVSALLLLPGCHRLGLVKTPKKAAKTAEATATASAPASTTTDVSAVVLTVENGGGVKGRGAAMVAKLQALGYTVPKATNAKLRYPTTLIYFKPGHDAEAAQVRNAIGIGVAKPATAKITFTSDVMVIVGKDF